MESDVLVGFLIGIGVGAAAALVMTPESGEQVRRRIRTKAEEGAEYLKLRGAELRTTASGLVDSGKKAADSAKQQIDEAVAAGKQAYREELNS
jgi:gas vesicle protein